MQRLTPTAQGETLGSHEAAWGLPWHLGRMQRKTVLAGDLRLRLRCLAKSDPGLSEKHELVCWLGGFQSACIVGSVRSL